MVHIDKIYESIINVIASLEPDIRLRVSSYRDDFSPRFSRVRVLEMHNDINNSTSWYETSYNDSSPMIDTDKLYYGEGSLKYFYETLRADTVNILRDTLNKEFCYE
jgi:hypothetical protein